MPKNRDHSNSTDKSIILSPRLPWFVIAFSSLSWSMPDPEKEYICEEIKKWTVKYNRRGRNIVLGKLSDVESLLFPISHDLSFKNDRGMLSDICMIVEANDFSEAILVASQFPAMCNCKVAQIVRGSDTPFPIMKTE